MNRPIEAILKYFIAWRLKHTFDDLPPGEYKVLVNRWGIIYGAEPWHLDDEATEIKLIIPGKGK